MPGGRYGVLTLDVSGHGAPAAIVMAMMRTLVHTYPGVPDDPEAMFRRLHDHFQFLGDTPVYATAVYAVVDPARGLLSVASAGHPPPLRFRRGAVTPLPCDPTTPLLLTDLAAVPTIGDTLERGDRILFFTDGVTDRESAAGEPYDVPRLATALAAGGEGPVERALASIVADIETFAGGSEPRDDNTLLLMAWD
jgi:sigma-B regulation protein RsbU (phosphoserine phosphatase)